MADCNRCEWFPDFCDGIPDRCTFTPKREPERKEYTEAERLLDMIEMHRQLDEIIEIAEKIKKNMR